MILIIEKMLHTKVVVISFSRNHYNYKLQPKMSKSNDNITYQKMTCSLLNIHVPSLQSFKEVASTCLL